jgi:hypothetical protein
MKTAHLNWREVDDRANGEQVIVHYDGIEKTGRCHEEHMMKMFRDCELLQLTDRDYMVTKWPERRQV